MADFWKKAKEDIVEARWLGELDITNDQHCSIIGELADRYNLKHCFG